MRPAETPYPPTVHYGRIRCVVRAPPGSGHEDETSSAHVSNIIREVGASNRIEPGEIGQQVGLR